MFKILGTDDSVNSCDYPKSKKSAMLSAAQKPEGGE